MFTRGRTENPRARKVPRAPERNASERQKLVRGETMFVRGRTENPRAKKKHTRHKKMPHQISMPSPHKTKKPFRKIRKGSVLIINVSRIQR
ncbi:Uncharacterised protein [Lysinibacillus sphaericus]|nr:Uncharacterised protein [Lysinibacillus sphaericus]